MAPTCCGMTPRTCAAPVTRRHITWASATTRLAALAAAGTGWMCSSTGDTRSSSLAGSLRKKRGALALLFFFRSGPFKELLILDVGQLEIENADSSLAFRRFCLWCRHLALELGPEHDFRLRGLLKKSGYPKQNQKCFSVFWLVKLVDFSVSSLSLFGGNCS